jgi:microcystin-dependent protein
MSTFSPNLNLEEVARGGDVGTWDTPTNSNWSIVDSVAGAIATIPLNNSNVILSAAQFQSRMLVFNSTLTGSVTITFPTSFTKSYEIQNACTGSSAFTITLETTVATGAVCCPPPGTICEVINNGTGIFFKNLPPVGSYWDYAGSSLPAWVSGSNPQPWLNCDGTALSSQNYPVLFGLIGATLPDRRGTVGVTLNQGTARTVNVINASSVGVLGGADTITLGSSQIPSITSTVTGTIPITFPVNNAPQTTIIPFNSGSVFGLYWNSNPSLSTPTLQSGAGVSNNTAGGSHGNVQPTTVYGISMIRAG